MAETRHNHPVLGEVTLSQTRRATRISIAVRPSGSVRLSFPMSVSARRALSFLETKVSWIESARQRLSERYVPQTPLSPDEIEEMRRNAKADLPARVEHFARLFGFRYGRVTIRATRSKWGSCSAENNISLSLYLMKVPEHLRDYVVIHELCHTVHHNHSAEFHRLADKCMGGNEKKLRSELRRYTTTG